MMRGDHSIVWPASASDPNASTSLTVADIIEASGGVGLRTYLVSRLIVVAHEDPDAPRTWAAFAVDHLRRQTADAVDGGIDVSGAAAQMVLAYIGFLEADRAAGAVDA